jgi:hypothetical protein
VWRLFAFACTRLARWLSKPAIHEVVAARPTRRPGAVVQKRREAHERQG